MIDSKKLERQIRAKVEDELIKEIVLRARDAVLVHESVRDKVNKKIALLAEEILADLRKSLQNVK